ncbi:hypothetical protein F0U44_16335 [Nocardioides humilatus]|uniref:Uncharacterized protein n=1 Tax=Nocardioides humilatus TaxID=2607660 RepID=A0A5B1L8Y0_9ACTN|nr:hypothetical protein [Nocardioides humilatus]KAA1416764.1 hypothetical protein F0U44_16335 [Nocardioides humilatus]
MRRVLLGLLLGGLIAATTSTAAVAERGSVADDSGGAPAVIDITKLTVKNRDVRVLMQVQVRDLQDRGRFQFYYWGPGGQPPAHSALVVVRLKDGEPVASFWKCGREDCDRTECDELLVEWDQDADVVSVSLRQDCFPRPHSDPDAPAPAVGRFFAYGLIGDHQDGTHLLTLDRG